MKPFMITLLLFLNNFLLAQNPIDPTKSQLIDSLLRESHRRGIFNGNALVVDRGKIIYNEAIGYADGSQTDGLKKEMLFMIGSISKEFDGVGIMILKEQGKLSLEDPISIFFPRLPQWATKIKVRDLLQYTSGLVAPDYSKIRTDPEVWEYLMNRPKLEFEPGTHYNYNNLNVFLRKRIIEKLSGVSYSQFVQKEILEPCHMDNTVIDPAPDTYNLTRSFDENYVEDDFDSYMSGWIATTTVDMYKWMQCLNSGAIINKSSFAELSESFKPGSESPLGYSAYENDKLLFRYHHGQHDNAEAAIAWIPDPGYTIILLTNNRCNELGDHINAIDAILRGEEFQIPKKSIELSLRAKIYHENFDAGLEFLKGIRENERDIYKFDQEEEELINTGTWLLEKERLEDGIRILQLTIQKFPLSSKAHLELARAYERTGENEQAKKYYRKAKEVKPKNTVQSD